MIMDFTTARHNMVAHQIQSHNIDNKTLLNSLQTLPREQFVLPEYQQFAYSEYAVPIGYNQTLLPPILVARILNILDIQQTDSVLEIGTGTGYLTALISQFTKQITSIEQHPELSKLAQKNLDALEIDSVQLNIDNFFELMEKIEKKEKKEKTLNQYNIIIFTGSLSVLPEKLQSLLKVNGRIFAFLGQAPILSATLCTLTQQNHLKETRLFETWVAPLEDTRQLSTFTFEF